jgi:hypothetical protein
MFVFENIFTSDPIWFLHFLCNLSRNISIVHFMAAKVKASSLDLWYLSGPCWLAIVYFFASVVSG